jgi:hypothetical protein
VKIYKHNKEGERFKRAGTTHRKIITFVGELDLNVTKLTVLYVNILRFKKYYEHLLAYIFLR